MTNIRVCWQKRASVRLGLLPAGIYLAVFVLYTWPLIRSFSTHFFADAGDGLQNVWNLWWVNKAITQLGHNPWFTDYLHYPYGISLLGHTLNTVNGVLGIPLAGVLNQVEVHNCLIVFSFVASGWTMFLLAYHLTHFYWPSIVAGFIFTFSNYHFAHAEGHMQLVAMQWIPLFMLLWYQLLTRPVLRTSLAAVVALLLVILNDYYYFLYVVIAALFMAAWYAHWLRDAIFFARPSHRRPLLLFLAGVLLTSGVMVLAVMRQQITDPLETIYVPEQFSLDLFALFIPGGHWRFHQLTEFYWSRLPGNIHESSVYLGWSVVALLIYVLAKRRQVALTSLGYWYFVLFFFALMSLGPVLNIAGWQVPGSRLPYDLVFNQLFPPLRVARVPVRMVVMVYLSAALISAVGFKLLFRQSRRTRIVASLLLVLLAIEYLPKPIPETRPTLPQHMAILRELPGNNAVVDLVTSPTMALYYQTIHERPMAFGYVSRIPASTARKGQELRAVINEGRYAELCRRYGFRYLLAHARRDVSSTDPSIRLLFAQGNVRLYDLGETCQVAVEVGRAR